MRGCTQPRRKGRLSGRLPPTTGGPGTHLIDVYPVLYTLSPSFANTPFGMLPVLSYQKDEPGLALGYKLPAIRLAITVVR